METQHTPKSACRSDANNTEVFVSNSLIYFSATQPFLHPSNMCFNQHCVSHRYLSQKHFSQAVVNQPSHQHSWAPSWKSECWQRMDSNFITPLTSIPGLINFKSCLLTQGTSWQTQLNLKSWAANPQQWVRSWKQQTGWKASALAYESLSINKHKYNSENIADKFPLKWRRYRKKMQYFYNNSS